MLPDPDDRHVVAAAIRTGAGLIVTFNLRDSPGLKLARHGLAAMHPDIFALELLARNPTSVLDVIAAQAADLKHPAHTALDVVGALERCGLSRFGALPSGAYLLGKGVKVTIQVELAERDRELIEKVGQGAG